MATMNNQEKALQYFKRLLKASNPKAELEEILSDINGLIFSKSGKPIDSATKIKIIEELEKLVKKIPRPQTESLDGIRTFNYSKGSPQASDNSDILDVISAMKKKVS